MGRPHNPSTAPLRSAPSAKGKEASAIGVIIVDHGSRRRQANDMLVEVVRSYAQHCRFTIVEPAHMELAEPSIATAFDRAVAQGARQIVVMPYFLLPGRHWRVDIPRLTAAAARKHPSVGFIVTEPLALHPTIHQIIDARIEEGLAGSKDESGDG